MIVSMTQRKVTKTGKFES